MDLTLTYAEFCTFYQKNHFAMLDILFKRAYKGFLDYENAKQASEQEYGVHWESQFEMDHGSAEDEENYFLFKLISGINRG